jgi:ABC-type multidrug transport system ATPase subunit
MVLLTLPQLDIEGLKITVTSGDGAGDKKAKSRLKGDGVEILSDAKLRLKAGQRYALVGRNGSGKSSTLVP